MLLKFQWCCNIIYSIGTLREPNNWNTLIFEAAWDEMYSLMNDV